MRDVTFGANEQCAPRELSVMPLMEAWAQQFPQLTALVGTSSLSGDPVQLSYSQFNARVNQLAWLLREQENIRAGSTVAVCLTRSPELVILLWAISKTGAAYCPLDPEWPVQRLTEVLLDLDAPIVVSQPDGHPRLTAALQATNRVVLTTNRLDLHQLILQSARMSKENLLVKVKPTLALWILFSSGTTGQPKASIMSHGGMFNVIKWLHADFPLEKEATLPFKTPYTFDVSTKELYWALTSGACLAVASPEIHKEVDRLPEYLHDNNIVAVHFVPTVLDIVIDECEERKVNLKHLRYVLVGGEAIAPETINRFYRAFENAQLFNWYGPCECHGMTCGLLQPGKKITIGRPIMNTAVYILDANLQEVDPGEPGEIWIGGATVGLGYLNRPEMTREKFRANPYASDLFVQNGWLWMYRTLDMGRKLKSGDFEFLGRVLGDAQVKLNGMRLELEEIEAHLVAHELVKFAAAAVITRGERQMLVAYIVPLRPEFFEDLLSELPGFLNLRVPAAFVPRSYVQLDALPFTSHHKLDRRSLATYSMSHEIEQAREKKEEITSCASTEDQVLAVISDAWRKVLRLQPGSFGTDDKFITVGGDSISAIRIASFCRSQGLQVTVGMVLRHETIQSLADACKTLQRDETAKLPAQKEKEFMIHGPVSLTPIQRWWQSLNFIHPNAWSSTFLFTSVRPVKEESVQKMLLSLVDHHDMLRARVSKSGHLSILPIGDADIHLLLRNVECATKDAMTQVINELPSSLNLTEGPVVSAALITRLDDDTQRLAICIHHMCVDLISWRVIIEDMANLMLGKPLPDKTTSFQQWAALLLERANMERGITWPWKAQPTSTRLTAFPEKIAEATISTRQFMDIAWTDKETQLLLEAAGALEASVLQILLTGFCLAFKDAVGGTSVTIDMEGHGREPWDDRIDLSRTVGWFTTNYPVEFDISGNDRYECLNGVKANLTKVPEKGLLYGIMKYLQQHSSEAHSSEILFNYFGTLDEGDDQVDAQWRMSDERRNGVDSMSGEELWPHRLLVEAALETRRLRAWIAFSPVVTEVELVRELSVKWQLAVMDLVTHATTAPPPTKDAISEAGWDQDRRAALLLDLQPLNLDVADIESILPCTSMQDGMIFGSIMDPSTYMVHWYAEMAKDVDIERLERTWNTIVRRHGALRSRFFAPSSAQPGCYQLVLNPEAPGAFVPITTDVVIQINAEDTFDRLIRAEQVRGFQPGVQPLRATLLTINDINGNTTMHKLLLSMSHVILDGWSLSNLLADLLRSYHSVPLPPTPTYSEIIRHVVTCNQNLALNAEQFWVAKLKDLQPAQDLALPKPAKPPRDNYATFHATFSIALDAIEITRKAKGVTMASLYRAVWAIVLARYTSQDDVCFGVTVSGRDSEMSNIEHAIGMMINTLPFRARVSSDMPFDVFVRAIHQESMSVFEYMQTPLSNLKKWARDSGAVLFRAIFVYENYGEAFEKLDSLFQNEQVVEYSDCSLVLMLRSNPASDVLQCKMLYDARIYDSQYIHTVIDEFAVLVKALEREEMWSQLLKQLPRMSDAGLQQISMLSRGEPALKGPISISQLVYQQADRTPYAIALQDDHWRLTYKEFVEAVDSLALRICELGVLPGNLVALLGTRSCQMVIGVFSIIRAGAGVVPIDAVLYPDARIQVMLQDAGCSVAVCTDITYADKLPEGMNSIVFDGQSKHSISSIEKNELPQLHSQLPLYVVYTSGSTGVPKGVLCKHDSAMNLIMQRPGNLSIRSGDIVLQSLNVSFDGAMWEMLACLCNGGLLVLRSDDIVQSMKKCTVVITTPSLLTSPGLDLDPAMFPKLRLLVLVGEKVSQSIASRWGSGRVELWNGYGPTETTMISHLTRLSPSKTVTVGRPIPGTVSYIVDRDGNRVPVGAIGEILIGGVCVSGGYINQEELNSTKFVCNPWQNEDSYSTLYKSGDYGRWLEDGSVEICGRLDNLLKIRGHRVEVGEIEACMRQLDHPSKKNQRWLSNAVICVQPGRVAKLTAFVTPVVPVDMVRAAMTEKVPSYLIPGRIAAVSEFPRTANGKVDMARLMSELEQNMLRIPEETVMESAAKYDGIDVDAAAATLRNAFATALRLPEADVNPSASFFYLGGDSISALRVVTLCRHAGLQVSIQDIFKLETAYAIASKAVEKVAGSKQIDTAVGTWTTSDTRQAILRKAFANALNLAVHEIDPSTSFFFLGGDSISSLRVVSVCREAGLVISARDLFHYETVNMIAANARGSDLKSECINSDISAVDIVKKAFAAALNIPMRQIDPEASFFYLGGDSISCMHVSSICRDGGLSVSARDIYKYETANAIASIAGQSSTSVRKQPLLRNARHHEGDLDRLPLSPVQRLFFSKNMKNPNYFTQAFYFDVNMAAPINMDLFKTTWSEIERHHDAFRLRFSQDANGNWRQHLRNGVGNTGIVLLSATLSTNDVKQTSQRLQRMLDIEKGPMAVAALLYVDGRPTIMAVLHHLIVDLVSWRIILEDLSRSFRRQPLYQPTCTWEEWVTSNVVSKPASTSSFPVVGISESLRKEHMKRISKLSCLVHQSITLKEEVFCRGAKVDDILLAGLLLSYYRTTGSASLTVDVEDHGRTTDTERLDVSRTIGWFTRISHLTVGGLDDSPQQIVQLVRRLRKEAKERQPSEVDDSADLADISFNYHGKWQQLSEPDAVLTSNDDYEWDSNYMDDDEDPWYSLGVECYHEPSGLKLEFVFDPDRFFRQHIERWLDLWRDAIQEICNDKGAMPLQAYQTAYGLTEQWLKDMQLSTIDIEDVYPCTRTQEGLILSLEDDSKDYLVQLKIPIHGTLNPVRLQQAWQAMSQNHALLRTRFLITDVRTLQIVLKKMNVEWHSGSWPGADWTSHMNDFLKQDRQRGFSMQEPLSRLGVFEIGADQWMLVWTVHHCQIDGWDIPLVMNALKSHYHGVACSVQAPAFKEYVEYVNLAGCIGASRTFWSNFLSGLQPTELPSIMRKMESEICGSQRFLRHVSKLTAAQLRQTAQRYRVTVSTLLRGAFALQLMGTEDVDDVVFGVTVNGRGVPIPGIDQMIGMCINTLPFRVKLTDRSNVEQFLRSIFATQAEVSDHEVSALADIRTWIGISDPRKHIFYSLLVYENYPSVATEGLLAPAEFEWGEVGGIEFTEFPLSLVIDHTGSDLRLQSTLTYTPEIIPQSKALSFLTGFTTLLECLCETEQNANVARILRDQSAMPAVQRSLATNSVSGWKSVVAECRTLPGIYGRMSSFLFLSSRMKSAERTIIPFVDLTQGDEMPTATGCAPSVPTSWATGDRMVSTSSEVESNLFKLSSQQLFHLSVIERGESTDPWISVSLDGSFDLTVLRECFQHSARRHLTLMLRLAYTSHGPRQTFSSDGSLIAFNWEEDASSTLPETRSPQFDLSHGPLVRIAMIANSTQDTILMLQGSAFVVDSWSLQILVLDALERYLDDSGTQPSNYPPPPAPEAFKHYLKALSDMNGRDEDFSQWVDHVLDADIAHVNPAAIAQRTIDLPDGFDDFSLIKAALSSLWKAQDSEVALVGLVLSASQSRDLEGLPHGMIWPSTGMLVLAVTKTRFEASADEALEAAASQAVLIADLPWQLEMLLDDNVHIIVNLKGYEMLEMIRFPSIVTNCKVLGEPADRYPAAVYLTYDSSESVTIRSTPVFAESLMRDIHMHKSRPADTHAR